ncbi:hypothetical protein CSAL01_13600 [Colletotrichum salicis]|uniref:Uncharacterized protein n=1 Tax=Colletotrichum salicis TaxID=1209931 RepID=A0A135VAC6_9PEZI|nr:hypothetical protein CSAL01_13600 [Colletotrichum salicis]
MKLSHTFIRAAFSLAHSVHSLLEKAIGHSKRSDQVEQLINVNQELCDGIVDTALDYYGLSHEELVQHSKAKDKAGQLAEKVSVSQALKHFVRDCLFPEESRTNVRALFPGPGIGRLAHEVASLGWFEVTMNEWSSFMNLTYRFLETHREAEMRSFHPFVDSWSHHATTADMLRPVSFPDKLVNASAVLLVEGDFTSISKHNEGEYDVIVTHFFIDTARNFMTYLDTIYSLLRTGGHWVNCGPLLWGTGPFVQLSLDEIVEVTKSIGFEFLESKKACGGVTLRGEKVRGKEALYGFDSKALTANAYLAQSWVAKKA